MKKVLVCCLLLSLWLSLDGSRVWAIDVGWMQNGVRAWYFGGVGSTSSSDAEEAYLFQDITGNNAQVTKHSGLNHWSTANPVDTITYPILDKGPCWIHPQKLQNLQSGETWKGQTIATVLRESHTYDSFKAKFSFPYLLLPIKALFDLKPQRDLVKIVYYITAYSTGIAYFDADTGLMLLYESSNGLVTVFFLLSEINYDFATQQAYPEDNGPHTGFKSDILEESTSGNYIMIQSSVETRYGSAVQMWVSTSYGGSISSVINLLENYCFFDSVPVLRHIAMTQAPNYPPDQWIPYGQYLWWWVPPAELQNSTINVFGMTMTKTSTNPYTFTASGTQAGLYFSKIIFDNDGYMTVFSAKDIAKGLDIDNSSLFYKSNVVYGVNYYKSTMGNATPVQTYYRLFLTVKSDTEGKGGGSVNDGGTISCTGHGSSSSGMSGTCQIDFLSGTNVTLYQTPDNDSAWATWIGPLPSCGTGQSCAVLMNGMQNVTVTFPYSAMAKVNSSGYGCDSLILAYGNAAPEDTIFGRNVAFIENLILNGNKSITLLGGRDAWYLPLNAWTTLQGKLTVQGGSLTVERLVIKKSPDIDTQIEPAKMQQPLY